MTDSVKITLLAPYMAGVVVISSHTLSFEAPEGIRLYAGVPKISEKAERGIIEAIRIETATYLLEKEGRYKFPEIVILWWDPQKKKMNKARLPDIEFKVERNPGYNAEVFASSEDIEGKPSDKPKQTILDRLKESLRWVFVVLGILLFSLAIRRILSTKGISIKSWLAEKQRLKANAEATYFKRFRKASLSNDPRTTLRELMFWLDRLNTQPEASTLKRFARESGMPELLKEGDALEGLLFARPAAARPKESQGEWSGKSFYKLVAKARRGQIHGSKRLKQSKERMLSLNPELEEVTSVEEQGMSGQ